MELMKSYFDALAPPPQKDIQSSLSMTSPDVFEMDRDTGLYDTNSLGMWRGCWGSFEKSSLGEQLRVFVAYDRCNGGNGANRDNQRFVDVVNGGSNRTVVNKNEYVSNRMGVHMLNKEGSAASKEGTGSARTIVIDDMDVNGCMLRRSVVGKVKAMCFLWKLPVLCNEEGLDGIEIKLLGGLEVMRKFSKALSYCLKNKGTVVCSIT
ncbi:hypothetical protein Tco_1096526 [Tanacetum coccineum]